MKRLQIFLLDNNFCFWGVMLIIGLLFNSKSFSQNIYTIQGKVIDTTTKEPLVYVSVYLSGTSTGTITDEKGIYKIINIPRGGYNLVASMVGYESKIIAVNLMKENNLVVDFNLERILYQFNQIEVRAEEPIEWKEQLAFFKIKFFGDNKLAEKCVIKNENKLEFLESEVVFSASINEPLKIVNNVLGYKIDCVLKNFVFNKKNKNISYEIYPAFTEIIPSTEDSLEDFTDNRNEVYLGSLKHLLSTLANEDLKYYREGFELFRGKIRNNAGRILASSEIVTYNSKTEIYVLNFLDTRDRMLGKSIVLRIDYSRDDKIMTSWIFATTSEGIVFDPCGYFLRADSYVIAGNMAKEGVATMLPRFWKRQD